jgi:hypothetical protein
MFIGDIYDYSLVEYKGNRLKVKIICPKHGIFEQRSQLHINGYGCYKCALQAKTKSKEVFIIESNKIHNNQYNYDKFIYINRNTPGIIICIKHNCEFLQTPASHLLGCKCPKCSIRYSRGEEKIENWLIAHKIVYITQHKFNDCKDKHKLPFDFYLPDYNICIEFDGAQHYEPTYGFHNLTKVIKHDNIKTQYCFNNKIKLIRIPYWDKNNISDILSIMISENVNNKK